MDNIIVLSTINDLEKAKIISRVLVGEKLAACVNIVPNMTSIYIWNEEIAEDGEYLMIIKTRKALFDQLKSMISEMHPYEVPEIISLNIENSSEAYLDWIIQNTK